MCEQTFAYINGLYFSFSYCLNDIMLEVTFQPFSHTSFIEWSDKGKHKWFKC